MRVLFRVAFSAVTLLTALAVFSVLWNLHGTEQVRAQDTFTFHAIVDQYILELGRAPVSPDDLLKAGYIKAIPVGVNLNDFFEEQPKQADPPCLLDRVVCSFDG